MDDKNKKRRRRKKADTDKVLKEVDAKIEKQKLEQQLRKETVEPVHDERYATERLVEIQNKVTPIDDKDLFKSLYTHWGHMKLRYVQKAIDDEEISVFERMTAARAVQAMKAETTNGMKIGQYIEERYAGKATQRVEHSGPNGSPINIHNAVKAEQERAAKAVSEMTPQEKKQWLKVLKAKKALQSKVEQRIGVDDESDTNK
jgi:predicted nucleic acid-binding protein